MRIDELKRVHQTRPFKPFAMRVADGKEYAVKHPEFLSMSITGRTIVVSTSDDLHELIDTAMITSIHFGNGKNGKSRRKKS